MYVRYVANSICQSALTVKGLMTITTADTDTPIVVPDNWIANAPPDKFRKRLLLLRVVILVNLALAFNYMIWRYLFSINVHALWFGIPTVVAETYSVIGNVLFSITMWKPTQRHAPPIAKFILAFRR